MANRFPLILNTSSNQIQEIASGDTLDLTGTGLNLTGITTLSTSAELNLGGGTNINTGTRGDILFYNASGTIQKLSLGVAGKVLQSNGTDLVYGSTGSVANVYYVSPSGTDGSGFGTAIDSAFKTIKYAVSNIGTPSATSPAIIFVKAGVYEETSLPIVVPAHTTIAGDSLRATIIKPASGLDSGGSIQNNRSVMFRMSNATVLQDLVMDGMGGYTPGSPAYKPENATIGGTYLALNAASVISTKSPYIYNCTSFGNGATGAVLDGALHSSGNRSMLFHTYTAVHSDGLGILLKANANAEMISTFTYYCTIGFACLGGSKIRSLNSSNAYGEYAVYSAGFDTGETANQGTVKGTMLTYTNVLTTSFTDGEQITGGTSSATAYVVNVQAEPKRIYIVQKSGTFQANETVTGGSSGATATLASASFDTNQSGRILVTTFSTTPDAGDSLQFASTDGNAYQIQSVSSVTANSVAYKVLVFSTSRATAVPHNTTVNVRKEFSLVRLTGHDFLQVGTGGTDTTNWPNNPTQNPAQADQVVTNETDPGRVYYTATDELGNFYVGDQFKVDQATGNVTLDASAFNLSGLESLRLGSVGGLIGAAVGEFSTDVTLSQNSDTKVSTQKAVKTYVDTLDDVTPTGGTFTVAGISTVTGTTHFTKQLNVSGVSTFHGNVNLLDGDRLRVGSSEDLQVYHDGNHSYISENGGGNLKIQASAGSILFQKDNGEEMIKATVDGAVELSHNNVLRLSTTSTGVSIGGSLTVPGNVSIGGTLTYEDVTNIDSVGVVTARSGLVSPNADIDDFISVGSNIHLGNAGVCTATTFVGNLTGNPTGSGANLTNLNASNIASGTVPTARLGSGTASSSTFLRGDSTFAVVDTALVADTSPQLGGDLDTNSHHILLDDNHSIKLGDGADAQLYHSGAHAYFLNTTGNMYFQPKSGEYSIACYPDGRVELYEDNALKLRTGVTGDYGSIQLQNGKNGWYGVSCNGQTVFMSDGNDIGLYNDTDNEWLLKGTRGGEVQLRYNDNIKFRTESTGNKSLGALVCSNSGGDSLVVESSGGFKLTVGTYSGSSSTGCVNMDARTYDTDKARLHKWTSPNDGGGSYGNYSEAWYDGGTYRYFYSTPSGFEFQHHVIPRSNNTYDLGTTGIRWRNIYTNDLNLSNEGGANEVDGTWGNYTIQEGESDLFLINKRNGKKYKFNLTEVS